MNTDYMSRKVTRAEQKNTNPAGEAGVNFRCPICGVTYHNELLTRVHITRADDPDHETHDGLMPETPVTAILEDGDTRSITRDPDDIKLQELEPGDLPESLSQKRKRIILVAAHNPYIDTYTELHERVEAVFDERDLGSISYQTVNRAVKEFFHLDRESDDNEATAQERYADMTEKQQHVIDAYLDDPTASYAELAEVVTFLSRPDPQYPC